MATEGNTSEKKKKPSIIIKIVIFAAIAAVISIGSIVLYTNMVGKEDVIVESRYDIAEATYGLKSLEGSNASSYAKVSISIACNDESLISMIEKDIVVIKDTIISTLSNKTSSELKDGKQKELLKKELVDDMNEILTKFNGDLKDKKITNVYFGSFILA